MRMIKYVLLFFVAIGMQQGSDALGLKKRNQAQAHEVKQSNCLSKRRVKRSKKSKKSKKNKAESDNKHHVALGKVIADQQLSNDISELENHLNETLAARRKTPKYDPSINDKDDLGRTALHHAIIGHNTSLAAEILRKGADYSLKDMRNRRAFDYAPYWMRYQIRRAYDRLPDPFIRAKKIPKKAAKIVEQLNEHGIVKLEKFVSAKNRKKLLVELEVLKGELISRSDQLLDTNCFSRKYVDNARGSLISNNPFIALPTLAEMMSMKKTIDIMNGYLGGTSWVQDAKVIIPIDCDSKGIDWHIDKQGNQLQLIILLADVPEESPYLSYVLGSHNIQHSFKDYSEGRINLALVKKHIDAPQLFHIHGKTGDAFLMHAEGLHKLNGFCATATCVSFSRYINFAWGLDLSDAMVENVQDKKNVFWAANIARKNKKSFFPLQKHWHNGLRQFDKWIDKIEK